MDEANEERRGYFRVHDEVLLAYRALDQETLEEARERLQADRGSVFALASDLFDLRQEIKPLQRASQTESAVAARYVDMLDRKLDRVVRYLLEQDMETGAVRATVDLGAEGMAFDVPHAPGVGALFELAIGLPGTCSALKTLGVVRRVELGAEGRFRIALAFHHLRDADRELLVQHTMRIQARRLRDNHAEAGGGEGVDSEE